MTIQEIMPFLLAGVPLMLCAWGALICYERVNKNREKK